MRALSPLALGHVAGEEDDDRVQLRRRQSTIPRIRMGLAGDAQHHRACRHPLPELVGERRERCVVDADGAKSVPREGDRDPPRIGRVGADRRRRPHLVDQPRQPRLAGRRTVEVQELVPRGERRRARHEEMLDVVQLEAVGHRASHARTFAYCDSSSIEVNASRIRNAFLISRAVTNGYSPYSRKLGC